MRRGMHAVECSGESLTNLSPYTMIKERSKKDIFVVRPPYLKSIGSAVLFSTELTTWKTGEKERKKKITNVVLVNQLTVFVSYLGTSKRFPRI